MCALPRSSFKADTINYHTISSEPNAHMDPDSIDYDGPNHVRECLDEVYEHNISGSRNLENLERRS